MKCRFLTPTRSVRVRNDTTPSFSYPVKMDVVPGMNAPNDKKPAGFSDYEKRAQEVLSDLKKTSDLIEQASEKARAKAGTLRSVWGDLQDLFRLLRAWANRSYTRVPWRAVVVGLAGVLYFVNPLDIAPDFVPFVGYLDDATVIAFVIRSIQQELDRFRTWEASPNT